MAGTGATRTLESQLAAAAERAVAEALARARPRRAPAPRAVLAWHEWVYRLVPLVGLMLAAGGGWAQLKSDIGGISAQVHDVPAIAKTLQEMDRRVSADESRLATVEAENRFSIDDRRGIHGSVDRIEASLSMLTDRTARVEAGVQELLQRRPR